MRRPITRESNMTKPALPALTGTILRKIDYVAVVSLDGIAAEKSCGTFEEAHGLVLEAKHRGADEAYVDERPISMIEENDK